MFGTVQKSLVDIWNSSKGFGWCFEFFKNLWVMFGIPSEEFGWCFKVFRRLWVMFGFLEGCVMFGILQKSLCDVWISSKIFVWCLEFFKNLWVMFGFLQKSLDDVWNSEGSGYEFFKRPWMMFGILQKALGNVWNSSEIFEWCLEFLYVWNSSKGFGWYVEFFRKFWVMFGILQKAFDDLWNSLEDVWNSITRVWVMFWNSSEDCVWCLEFFKNLWLMFQFLQKSLVNVWNSSKGIGWRLEFFRNLWVMFGILQKALGDVWNSSVILAWFSDGPRSLALTPSSPRLMYFIESLVPDVIVCLNSRRTIGSQLYCLLEFEPLKCKQWLGRRQICFCAVSSELFLACSRFAVGLLRRFLSTPSESYENVHIVQGNDFTITRKIW